MPPAGSVCPFCGGRYVGLHECPGRLKKTAARFGTDKCIDTALRVFEGFENRRAWEAMLFAVHPRHCGSRDALGVETAFTVILP